MLKVFYRNHCQEPQPMSLTSHWLAIEGVQPQIPQNPVLPERNVIGEPVTPVASKSETSVLPGNATSPRTQKSNHQVKHVLSKEHQLLLWHFNFWFAQGSSNPLGIFLTLPFHFRFGKWRRIQKFLPLFRSIHCWKCSQSLLQGLRLRMTMDMAGSLLNNEHLFIEPYLHQLMPSWSYVL